MENQNLVRFAIAAKKLKVVSDLVAWLDANKRTYEYIDIHCWTNSNWYLVIENTKIQEYYTKKNSVCDRVSSARIGFTVSIESDRILWVNDRRDTTCGGNCFVRSRYWLRKFREKFPKIAAGNKHIPENTGHTDKFIYEYPITPDMPRDKVEIRVA